MVKQYEVLRRASLFLHKNNSEQKIAELLLQHYKQESRTEFYANMHDTLPQSIINQLWEDLNKHVETGVPVQHLIGYEYFYGRKFYVNDQVLIPRPETEELVDYLLKMIREYGTDQKINIADIGTGSGVIAITLACELKEQAIVYATDISEKALKTAQKNAAKNKAKVHFFQGDFLEPLIDQNIPLNIIVSNPPYIAFSEKKSLSRTVKNFDPEIALFAKSNGLAAYDTIINQSRHILKSNRLLAFEIGYNQGAAVQELLQNVYPKSKIHIQQDINGHDRIVLAYIYT